MRLIRTLWVYAKINSIRAHNKHGQCGEAVNSKRLHTMLRPAQHCKKPEPVLCAEVLLHFPLINHSNHHAVLHFHMLAWNESSQPFTHWIQKKPTESISSYNFFNELECPCLSNCPVLLLLVSLSVEDNPRHFPVCWCHGRIFSQKTATAKKPTHLTGSNTCAAITQCYGGISMKTKYTYLDPNNFSNR